MTEPQSTPQPAPQKVTQVVFVVVDGRQAEELMRALNKARYFFTRIDSAGFSIQESTACLMIGVDQPRLNGLMRLIEETCQPRQEYVPVQFNPPAGFPPMSMIEARIGGASVFHLEVERFEQF